MPKTMLKVAGFKGFLRVGWYLPVSAGGQSGQKVDTMPGLMGSRLHVAIFALLGCLALVSLLWPAGGDQAFFMYVANTIRDGGLPYVDAWDIKGPLTYLLYLPYAWTGSFVAIRLIDCAFLAVALFSLYRWTTKLAGKDAGMVAVAILGVYYLTLGWWNTAQPDAWASMLLLIALERKSAHSDRALPAILLVAALLLKISFLIYVPLYFFTGRSLVKDLTLVGAVLLAAIGVMAASGILIPYLEAHLEFSAFHQTIKVGGSLTSVISATLLKLSGWPFLLFLVPVAVGIKYSNERWILGFWCVLALASIVIQGKLWEYHWITLYIPLAILTGVGLARIGMRAVTGALLLFFVANSIWRLPPSGSLTMLPGLVSGKTSLAEYQSSFVFSPYSYPASRQVADWVCLNTEEDARLLIWSDDPLIACLAKRRIAGAYLSAYPLIYGGSHLVTAKHADRQLAQLIADPPDLVIVNGDSIDSRFGQDRELADFVIARYVKDTSIAGFTLLRKK